MANPNPNENDPETVTLHCACCGRPFARLKDGRLVVESHHWSAGARRREVHVNSISVDALVALVKASSRLS